MISGRRVAREVALLVLFAVDLDQDTIMDDILPSFWASFMVDDEVLGDLFVDESGAGDLGGTVAQAHKILSDESGAQRVFVERLVNGVADHLSAIDDLISRYSLNWKVARMSRVDRNILRLAAYELAFESDVPTRATLNEAIEIAKRFGTDESGKFVNGILDKIAQELGRV